MNFLADENVDRQIVDRLRQDGHILRYVVERIRILVKWYSASVLSCMESFSFD